MDDPFDSETTDEVDAFDAAGADEASDAAGAEFDAG